MGAFMDVVNKIKVPLALLSSVGVGLFVFKWTWSPQIALAVTLTLSLLTMVFIADKYKGIAFLLALFPVIPANRLYTWNWDNTVLIRMCPPLGNIYDLYRMFISKTLSPSGGWSDKLFPLIG
jgi:hypothetical protein